MAMPFLIPQKYFELQRTCKGRFVRMTSQQRKTPQAKQTVLEKAAVVEVSVEDMANTNAPAGGITKEQALEKALKHSGVAKADISYIQVKPDVEEGMKQFDVEFYVGMMEYSFEVDARTGQVVDFDSDVFV